MTFTMFSAVPMPQIEWKKENMRYMLCALPLVGVVIGACLCLWAWIAEKLRLGAFLYAVGLTLLPAILSGGIHVDGFLDTADALSSHAAPEKKREILKDSHTGAFAVIFAVGYFLLYAALCAETQISVRAALLLGLTHVFARAVGALASTAFPGNGSAGLLTTFRDAAVKRASAVLIVWLVLCGAALVWLAPIGGSVAVALALACLLYLYFMSRREFGGMSGDLAGFCITLTELMMLLGYVFAERVAAL